MTVAIPAVDISYGKCVRLTKGKIENSKVYYNDPLDAALRWEGEGAEILHLIDLDAAVGVGDNSETLKRILKSVGIPVEVGGGIRSIAKAQDYVRAGACRVILGTAALDLKIVRGCLSELGPEKVMAAVDQLMGRVAIKGWNERIEIDAIALCRKLEEAGVKNFMMTSIDRDGTMKGPNIEYSMRAAESLNGSMYLAGGFSSLGDLMLVRGSRVAGLILGKSLYEGAITLKDAREVLG